MASDFDPYYRWLGIPPKDQPPNHYRLLGLELFETQPDVIDAAANRMMAYLRDLAVGDDAGHTQPLLNEIARARICLLNADRKAAYDKRLQAQLAAAQKSPSNLPTNGDRAVAGTAGPEPSARPIPVSPAPAVTMPVPQTPDAPIPVSPRAATPIPVNPAVAVPLPGATTPAAGPSVVKPGSSHVHRRPRRKRSNYVAYAVSLGLPLLTLAVLAAIWFRSAQGQLIIECGEPGVEVAVTHEGQVVEQRTLRRRREQIKLGVGSFEVALVGGNTEGLVVENGQFELKRDGMVVVRVVRATSEGAGLADATPVAGIAGDGTDNRTEDRLSDTQASGDALASAPPKPPEVEPATAASETPGATMTDRPEPEQVAGVSTNGRGDSDGFLAPPGSAVLVAPEGQAPARIEPPKRRLPLPDLAALNQARGNAKDAFESDLAAATSFDSRLSLATRMQEVAKAEADPAARFALYEKALGTAAQAPHFDLVIQLADELERQFEVDAWPLRLKAMSVIRPRADSQMALLQYAEGAQDLAEQAVALAAYDNAQKLHELADDAAKNLRNNPRNNELKKQLRFLGEEIKTLKSQYDLAEQARSRLEDDPGNPEDNLTLGKYLCFVREAWDEGLPHLARGSDADLRKAAEKDQAGPETPVEQFEVAELWWSWLQSPGSEPRARKPLMARAGGYYVAAVDGMTGITKELIEKRLGEIRAEFPDAVPAFAGGPDMRGPATPMPNEPVTSIRPQIQTEDIATAVAISPDGALCVYGTRAGRLVVWTPRGVIRRLDAHGRVPVQPGGIPVGGLAGIHVSSLAFSPDTRQLVSCGSDGTVRVWDVATWSEQRNHPYPPGLTLARFSRDGRRLVIGGQMSRIDVRDAATGDAQQGILGSATSLAISPDSQTVAVGQQGIRLYDLKTGQERRSFGDSQVLIESLAFSFDGRLLASTDMNRTLRIWEVNSGRQLRAFQDSAQLGDVVFCQDAKRNDLVAVGAGHFIKILDANNGKFKVAIANPHVADPRAAATVASPVSSVTVSENGRVIAGIWGRLLWFGPVP